MIMENPMEFRVPETDCVVVTSSKTVLLTCYEKGTMITHGVFKVTFMKSSKLTALHFSHSHHEELFSEDALALLLMDGAT